MGKCDIDAKQSERHSSSKEPIAHCVVTGCPCSAAPRILRYWVQTNSAAGTVEFASVGAVTIMGTGSVVASDVTMKQLGTFLPNKYSGLAALST